ncbi:uncharacterized protein FA14DRAFT_106271, partial [Meira miltonrushii]
TRVPIKVIIFDAFDTLITPRSAPYLQYAEEARKVGLQVQDEDVKKSFKSSFKQLAKQYPVYGLNTGLSSPDDWWLRLIQQTMIGSGIQQTKVEDAMPILGPALLNRFGSAEAYKLAEGVPDVFEKLNELKGPSNADLTLSLATNSDQRILNACKDLGLGRFLDLDVVYDSKRAPTNISDEDLGSSVKKAREPVSGPTLSYDVGFEKPSKEFFHFAVQRIFPFDQSQQITLAEMCKQTLYVGDHFEEDYLGAKSAGLQAAWLRR